MTLDLRMLLQVGKHYDEGDTFIVHHAPEVLDRRLKRALSRDEQLVVARNRRVDVVCIDVRIGDVLVALNESHTCVLNYYFIAS